MPPTPHEAALFELLQSGVSAGRDGFVGLLRRPATAMSLIRAILRIPKVTACIDDGAEGDAVRKGLSRRARVRVFVHEVTSVLEIPADPAQYVEGSSKQTLRRKVRAAERAGVTWKRVTEPEERQALLEAANEFDRKNPLGRYRHEDADNSDLFEYRLWLAAYAADGRPLLLSVTPVSSEWAMLRYFRTVEESDEASLARYLMTRVLVDELSAMGARHLADNVSPIRLSEGLRHFQRMVGFRLVRVALGRRPAGVA
ncbi:hypothetical protein [Amnibacterium sp.]|uniref:hypothetical protein n=1 Tax=Amnibacterium sp. TaxID=1872496 RepID=UPI0026218D85|nr:hypothetical protein [Amnibacterium sp.]MCU1473895.1 hypothetical protein [Amnibacterium sp.]